MHVPSSGWATWFESLGVKSSWEDMDNDDYQYLAGWWWQRNTLEGQQGDDPERIFDGFDDHLRASSRLRECFVMGWRDAEGYEEKV